MRLLHSTTTILVFLFSLTFIQSVYAGPNADGRIIAPPWIEVTTFTVLGDADAQFRLGRRYADGEGVPEDDVEAAKWFRKAAEQGHADAQFILGLMYAKGEGVLQDDTEAVMWFRKAAAQGNIFAQFAYSGAT